ncbi:MAG: helix-turn-helix domain-containing protein [Chitinivibrionales bacterium]|nr:helix-turn-helix domain-containing protein [Chitinivibrionales bacterium]
MIRKFTIKSTIFPICHPPAPNRPDRRTAVPGVAQRAGAVMAGLHPGTRLAPLRGRAGDTRRHGGTMGSMRAEEGRGMDRGRCAHGVWTAAAVVCVLAAASVAAPPEAVAATPRGTVIAWPALVVIVFNLLLFVVWFFGRRIRAQMERTGRAPEHDDESHDTTLLPLAVTRAIGIIERRYHEQLDVRGVAAEVRVKPGYLAKLFKDSTGKSLAEYVNDFRLEQAAELIRSTRLGLTEIQRKVGIHDPSWFTEAFQRKLGTSPAELMRQRGGEN